jgi:3-methyl-2-oxobutanoate hydroxymethyltransferase
MSMIIGAMLALPVVGSALQEMKRDGRKIVGVVAWDDQMAQIADRAGVDLISVGDSAGDITLEEMLILCRAVRRGVTRALLSVDLPAHEQNFAAALRLKECGAELVKLLGSADLVRSVVRAGVPVFAEFHGGKDEPAILVEHARRLEDAGATLLDFRNSGALAGAAVARAVRIPVVGGLGGGPWLDGRVAQVSHDALAAYAEDVRAARETRDPRG